MPGMPRRLFSATPSKLATFADCARRYRYADVDRPTPPKGPAWAHNTVGAAVHAALRSWWDLPVAKRTTGGARQLLYVLGVRRTLRRPCSRVELHHLPSGTVAAFEHTERSLANHVRRAEDIAEDITAATERAAAGEDPDAAFPAVPGQQCSWCDFRPSCPTGQAAVPARETWGFLSEDDVAT
ncbi:PD-(D/E)XK nuclease family protein [Blastococcus brunescens]|uniref:PD-(D/E)XK nuclease family protein n=1 Tax=Blastococcus brunescens TaxID=1564165 RepID=A0ABZ1B0H9_9ACTN|nr:PD-(D/E)XK nuclease family protein [Blastococcus sp. BMG 8361]WRL62824.1 PD-(D/E)XK nuclease family protein [Blastococcus sp. BMG 8361]